MTENKEQYELFFQMERDFELFNIRTCDGFPLWDIIRYQVWRNIIFPSSYEIQNNKQKSFRLLFRKLFFCMKSLLSFSKLLFYKADFFYFGNSRVLNDEGCYYDPYFDSIKHLLHGNVIFYESNLYKSKYTNDNRFFDILPYFKRFIAIVLGFIRKKKAFKNDEFKYIYAAINQSFGKDVFNYNEIETMLNEFRIEFIFFKWLLKVKKIKRVILLNNGQKSLIKAAKINNIPVFEFQHGDIVDATILYNYGFPEFNINDNIIFPDVLLTFSNIWTKDKFIPGKCIELGSDFFCHSFKEGKEKNSITILSSNEQNVFLQELALNLSNKFKKLKIYYKLHPQQYNKFQEQKIYFKDFPNIQVVSIEKNLTDILSISDEFIAIYSTAIFELLQSGKIVYIYKRLNYNSFKSYFNLPNVHLFDKVEDLIVVRENALNSKANNISPDFFKPFSEEVFLNVITD